MRILLRTAKGINMSENEQSVESNIESTEAQPEMQQEAAVVQELTSPETEVKEVSKDGLDKNPEEQKFKLKIDGEDVELTENEMKRYASMGKAAQKRMQEAAEIRKQHESLQRDVETFIDILKKEPERVLKDLGIDPDVFAEQQINKKLEQAAKSPEQIEKERILKELEDAHKKLKEVEESKKKEEQQRYEAEYAKEIEKDLTSAFENSKIPKDPLFVRRVADLLFLGATQGVELKASDVLPLAQKQAFSEFKGLVGVLSDEMLEEVLGNERISNLRKRYIKNIKPTPESLSSVKETATQALENTDKNVKKVKSSEFFKKIGSY